MGGSHHFRTSAVVGTLPQNDSGILKIPKNASMDDGGRRFKLKMFMVFFFGGYPHWGYEKGVIFWVFFGCSTV